MNGKSADNLTISKPQRLTEWIFATRWKTFEWDVEAKHGEFETQQTIRTKQNITPKDLDSLQGR